MPYTISGTYSTLVTLGSLSDNPTTITATALLTEGLSVSYSGLSVVNAGTIIGGSNDGIVLLPGGSVTNQSGGSISGDNGIYGQGGALTVVNAGSIAGSTYAVKFSASGTT